MADHSHPLFTASLRHRDELLALAWVRCRDWSLADDAVQEAFLIAMRRWPEFDQRRPLLPWLAGIVRNTVRSELRKRDRNGPQGDLLEHLADAAEEAVDTDDDRLGAALAACIQDLPQRSRELLRSYFIASMPVKTIAAAQGRTVNAIDLALSRLRRALRACADRRLAREHS